MTKISVVNLGLCDYQAVRLQQKKFRENLINGGEQLLISCQHNPIITYGKSKLIESLLVSEDSLKKSGYQLSGTERGGDITCHEPGQQILYPIINLNNYKRDVAWYLRQLEQVVINSLAKADVSGIRVEGKTGVWISETKKIASIGVSLSRWCTMHGLAINLNNSLYGFKLITPCGLSGIETVKLEDFSEITPEEFERILIQEFLALFQN